MAAGGGEGFMNTLVQQVRALHEAYRGQLEIYGRVLHMAEQERSLLERGQVDQLVESLRGKQVLLAEIDDSTVTAVQAKLADQYGLSEFSIPKMLQAAAGEEKLALEHLQDTLVELVSLLEKIEALEKENESILRGYSKVLSGVSSKERQAKQAAEAYTRASHSSQPHPEKEESGDDS